MKNEDIVSIVTAVATIVATVLSYIAIRQANKSIKQTEKNSVINSNQFLFDRRLELVNYFRAVLSIANNSGLHMAKMNEYTRKDAENDFTIDKKIDQLSGILNMQFGYFTNDLLFYEFGTMIVEIEEGSFEDFKSRKLKCVICIAEINTKIESINYLFPNKSVKLKLTRILEGYITVLEKYMTLFYQLHKIKGAYDFDPFFIKYDEAKVKANDLKEYIESLNMEEVNAEIQKDLSVF